MAQPVVYMLCGLPGSGKTVYAKRLECAGRVRLSFDELVHARHGRYDVDYPARDYPRRYAEAATGLDGRLVGLLEADQPAVLDYGLWERSGRERYKGLVEAHGGGWELLYFKAEPDVLRRRLAGRNLRTDANALAVSDEMLSDFIARFEEPNGEGAQVLIQTEGTEPRPLDGGTVLRMREPDLPPTSYLTLAPGTSVVDRFGQRVGPVERVLLHTAGSFDGIIVRTRVGRRFVDAPDVRRISARAVTLGIAAGDVECPAADRRSGRDGVPAARWDRTEVTEADRDAVIDSLKTAFVREELTTDGLAQRVETAHVAETLDKLDATLEDLTLG